MPSTPYKNKYTEIFELIFMISILGSFPACIFIFLGYGFLKSFFWGVSIVVFLVCVLFLKKITLVILNFFDPKKATERNQKYQLYLNQKIELQQRKILENREKTAYLDPTMTGHAFEGWCAKRLRAFGWKVEETRLSGDQGADLIATKYGTRMVIQCKLHSKNVGNKAVQEVFAAQRFYDADSAAVIANGDFTTGAIKLAKKTGVLLIKADAIDKL